MRILGIETSCDETAVCILDAQGTIDAPNFSILGNALYSQIAIHAKYGGVFPNLAKREHAANLVPLMEKALADASLNNPKADVVDPSQLDELKTLLVREPSLFEQLENYLQKYGKPNIDAIAVTYGPGLEPALWVGINFAKALSLLWNIPLYPINHMEGHIVSPLFEQHQAKNIAFPALSLLISGGHTEIVLMKNWLEYEVVGQTKDDAVGEAFDKVARMLQLPYPGGPEISKLAEQILPDELVDIKFPRPMLHSPDLDFSFSGLKTAILYFIKKQDTLTPALKAAIARDFENSVVEVLTTKTRKAMEQHHAKTLILGGGVIANKKIRNAFEKMIQEFPESNLLLPQLVLSTDNAVMIALAGYFNILMGKKTSKDFVAQGNLSLSRN
jgi:N6-L-threonylcarbamoyladenine synthase